MPQVILLTESELRQCVTLEREAVDLIDRAFATLATGGAVMPPILGMEIPEKNGEVDVKTAYVSGLDGFAIKVSTGFFDNPKVGLPSLNGLMVVLSADTGLVQAVLLDNGYLTDVRTAAAGAVAAKHLAPQRVSTAAVIGAGLQARLQIQALSLVRDFDRLVVWARDSYRAAAYAERMAEELGKDVVVAPSAEACVREAQVVVTTTPAREPVIQADWLHPDLHITAMGSDAPEKNELAPAVLTRADRVVVDRKAQSLERGELRAAVAAGVFSANAEVDELGAICAGQVPGREEPDEITVCDLTGTGIQDTAIATHALAVAKARGFGTVFES